MAVIRGQSYVYVYVAWDTAGNTRRTGDAANHTVYISKDGGNYVQASNAPSEILLPNNNPTGTYRVTLTASEMDANTVVVYVVSSTSGVTIPVGEILTERGRVDTTVSSRATAGDVWSHSSRTLTGNVTVGSSASGQNPADYVLATPANKLATDSSGRVTVGSNADKSGYSLSTGEHSNIASAVWSAGTRTLTSFGTLVNDTATAVWSYTTRTLTSFGTLVADIWSHSTRTLTSLGTLANDTANAVWGYSTRTLTSFGTLVSDVAAAVWSHVIEGGQSALAWMRLMGAALFGKLTRSGINYAFRDWDDTKDRIVGTVDSGGNRSITSRDGS